MGVYGQVDIRSGRSREITREYVSGTIYEDGFHTNLMINNPENVRAQLEKPAIFLSDLEIKEPDEIVPVVRAAIQAGETGLVVVCRIDLRSGNWCIDRCQPRSGTLQSFGGKNPGYGSHKAICIFGRFGGAHRGTG